MTQRKAPAELPIILLALLLPAAGTAPGAWGSLADIMVILVLSLLVMQRGKQPSLLKAALLVLGFVLFRNFVRDVLIDMVSIAACVWLGLRNKKTAILVVIAAVAGVILVVAPKVLENPWALMLPFGKLLLLLGVAHILVVGSEERWKTGTVLFWAAAVGLVYGLAVLFSTGPDPLGALNTYLKQEFLPETLDFYRQSGVVQMLEARGIPESDLVEGLTQSLALMARLFPSLVMIYGILVAVGAFLLVQLAKKFGRDPGFEIKRFREWRLPWYAVWGGIIALASYLGGDYFNSPVFVTIGLNLGLVYLLVCTIIGASVMIYFLALPRVPRFFKIIFVFISFFYFAPTLIMLALVGIFDLVLNFRRFPDFGSKENV